MNFKETKKKIHSRKHRAVSPILATVILLGVTVVGGGMVFALLTQGVQSTSASNVIFIENSQAVKGTNHADLTATIKNAGNAPWTKVEMTVGKSGLSEPLLYESLHENVGGCGITTTDDTACKDAGPAKNRDNPLRAQWLIHLDKDEDQAARVDGHADKGEGASVGRKLVFESKDSYRTVDILNGTDIAMLFGGQDSRGNDSPTDYSGNIATADFCSPGGGGSFTNCIDTFKELDSSVKGDSILCTDAAGDDTIAAKCKVFTHRNIEDNPVSPGNTIYFYADVFTEEIPGLGNLKINVGDGLVINLFTTAQDGSTARAQTIIKVTGI